MMLSAGKTETKADIISDIFLEKEEYQDTDFRSLIRNTVILMFFRIGMSIPQR